MSAEAQSSVGTSAVDAHVLRELAEIEATEQLATHGDAVTATAPPDAVPLTGTTVIAADTSTSTPPVSSPAPFAGQRLAWRSPAEGMRRYRLRLVALDLVAGIIAGADRLHRPLRRRPERLGSALHRDQRPAPAGVGRLRRAEPGLRTAVPRPGRLGVPARLLGVPVPAGRGRDRGLRDEGRPGARLRGARPADRPGCDVAAALRRPQAAAPPPRRRRGPVLGRRRGHRRVGGAAGRGAAS